MDQTESKFIKLMRQKKLFSVQDRVLVAVSGGSDSLALLKLLLCLPQEMAPTIQVATVDFALRKESSAEVALVKKFCQVQQIPFYTTVWKHSVINEGMELRARNFRYKFFAQLMQNHQLNKLVTAHQSDDQAETVLMKLIRSGSFWESSGIAEQRAFEQGQLIRPLLDFTKGELQDYLKRCQITYAVDKTNFEDITMRNRIRKHVIPLLQMENSQFNEHITNFTHQTGIAQQIVQKYFQQVSQQAISCQNHYYKVNLTALKIWNPAEIAFFIQFFLHQQLKFDMSSRQLLQLEHSLLKSSFQLVLSRNLQIIKNYKVLLIGSLANSLQVVDTQRLQLNQPAFANFQQKITIKQVTQESSQTFYFDYLPQKIILRPRKPGDRVLLLNGHHQKLKKRLIDLKMPRWQRENLWLLEFDNQIVWVPNVYRYQIKPTSYLFEVTIGEANEYE